MKKACAAEHTLFVKRPKPSKRLELPALPALSAQITCRAVATAVAPIMAMRAVTHVAGVGVLHDEVH